MARSEKFGGCKVVLIEMSRVAAGVAAVVILVRMLSACHSFRCISSCLPQVGRARRKKTRNLQGKNGGRIDFWSNQKCAAHRLRSGKCKQWGQNRCWPSRQCMLYTPWLQYSISAVYLHITDINVGSVDAVLVSEAELNERLVTSLSRAGRVILS